MDADLEVAAIARRQHGAVARVQALACGMTDGMIRSRHRTGRWERSRAGVYVFAGVPPSHRQSVLVALLAAGAGAVASHLTAASLWGLPSPNRTRSTSPGVRSGSRAWSGTARARWTRST
jgi:hypothetical protein